MKTAIENLARNWNWWDVSKHPSRSLLLSSPGAEDEGYSVRVFFSEGRDLPRKFLFRVEKTKQGSNLEICTVDDFGGIFMWKTYTDDREDSLEYLDFTRGDKIVRLPLRDMFYDPKRVQQGEMDMFKTLYPDFSLILPFFNGALLAADQRLSEEKIQREVSGGANK